MCDVDAAQFGQHGGNARQLARRVAPAAQPGRRDVRGVGFKDDGIERQFGGQRADARRAGKGHGATETELETELDELVGLLTAAVEGVGDAAAHADATQVL